MVPLNAEKLFQIFFCSPMPVAIDRIIMTIPMAIAEIAIFIIGAEILLLRPFAVMSLLAIKYSRFNSRFWICLSKVQLRCELTEFGFFNYDL
jgi:hypothetical protein